MLFASTTSPVNGIFTVVSRYASTTGACGPSCKYVNTGNSSRRRPHSGHQDSWNDASPVRIQFRTDRPQNTSRLQPEFTALMTQLLHPTVNIQVVTKDLVLHAVIFTFTLRAKETLHGFYLPFVHRSCRAHRLATGCRRRAVFVADIARSGNVAWLPRNRNTSRLLPSCHYSDAKCCTNLLRSLPSLRNDVSKRTISTDP